MANYYDHTTIHNEFYGSSYNQQYEYQPDYSYGNNTNISNWASPNSNMVHYQQYEQNQPTYYQNTYVPEQYNQSNYSGFAQVNEETISRVNDFEATQFEATKDSVAEDDSPFLRALLNGKRLRPNYNQTSCAKRQKIQEDHFSEFASIGSLSPVHTDENTGFYDELDDEFEAFLSGKADEKSVTAPPTPPESNKPDNTDSSSAEENSNETAVKGKKRSRQTYTRQQTLALEREYNCNQYLTRRRRIEISNTLNLTPKQIKIWFQNRRMKAKNMPPTSPASEYSETQFYQAPIYNQYTDKFAAPMMPNIYHVPSQMPLHTQSFPQMHNNNQFYPRFEY